MRADLLIAQSIIQDLLWWRKNAARSNPHRMHRDEIYLYNTGVGWNSLVICGSLRRRQTRVCISIRCAGQKLDHNPLSMDSRINRIRRALQICTICICEKSARPRAMHDGVWHMWRLRTVTFPQSVRHTTGIRDARATCALSACATFCCARRT
jgi:hypothetical protein